jgi:integrase
VTVLTMARPTRHKQSGIFYFRKVIPERLREAAGKREFKRSLDTADVSAAKKKAAVAALEYEEFIESLQEKQSGQPSSPREDEPATLTRLSPADTHELAGELYRWLMTEHAANPTPSNAFSNIAPAGPWGHPSEPWTGQRYQLVQARRARIPASSQRIVSGRVKDKTKEKPRRPYTNAEAAKLLKAARKRTDALRWLTWLMAYTGARINELAQLRKEDVKAKSGIPFIGITSSDEKGHEIKTSSSRREVPLHKAVIAEGFLKWVAKQRDGWLFSDLPAGRYGKRGDAASKRYGRWQRGEEVGISDARAVAHSWRHRIEDQFRDIEVPDEVADSILGHARSGQRATYGDGPPLRVKTKWISALPATRVGT